MKHFFTSVIVLLLWSCSTDKNEEVDVTAANEEEILAYIEANDLFAVRSASGLYYVVNAEGSGVSPTPTSNVTVAYRGYFTNGNTFDDSSPEGISFNLNQVIPGWTEGLTYFNEGGNGILLIPSRLGYGNTGRGSIPGGAVLIFDINLISVN
jgi:FKBP-type peptidyl-prolyl cis-trans isomerase FkpA